ncbi:MAG: hypothetical protein LBL38_01145, partial [Lactobacillales bacterium]|nr:hypothetical protein [Lactobacillales bacterium]
MRFLLKNVSSIPSSSIVNDYNRTENAWAQRYERANLGDNQNDNKFTLQDFAQLNDSKQKNFIKDFLDPTKGRGNMQDILTLIMNDTSHYGSNNANLKEFVHTLLSDFRNELISFFNGEIAGNNSDGDRSRQLLQLIIRNANPNDLKSFINSTSDKDFLEKLINNDCDNKVHSVVEELITTGSRAQREKFENILSNTDSLSTDSLSNVGKLREWGLTKYNKVMDGSGTIS